jgi:signal transduction histidine kinase
MRPAAFTTPESQDCLILGALRTRQRVLGMFAAVLQPTPTSGWDANITVLATYLACAADAIFSEEFMVELQEHNRKLDHLVRQRTQQLEAAKNAAEVANRAKDTFLATISHELRTPLNAVLGYSQRLRECPDLKPAQADQIRTIHYSAEHLLSLINDLLDLAKAEATHIELCPAQTDIRRLVREIAGIVRHRADEKQLAFRCAIEASTPEAIETDAKRLKQVLINLLGNAIKFTHQGSVELRITRTNGFLRFCVADTGCGIAPAAMSRLGQPFQQLGDTSQRAGGSGLGLAISKKLIHALGGELGVKSEPGKGSEFWFDLACSGAPAQDQTPAVVEEVSLPFQPDRAEPPLELERLEILLRLADAGEVLELRAQLEAWAAAEPGAATAESKLLALAKGFRINAIKQILNRQKDASASAGLPHSPYP